MDRIQAIAAILAIVILSVLMWFTFMGEQLSQPSGLLALVGVAQTQQQPFSGWSTVRVMNETHDSTSQNETVPEEERFAPADSIAMEGPGIMEYLVCDEPYVMMGSMCCLDLNANSMCDEGEQVMNPRRSAECPDPYSRLGTVCCIDIIDDGKCDNDIPDIACGSGQISTGSGCCDDLDNDMECDPAPSCESPYLIINGECCVDFNANGRCDERETPRYQVPENCTYPYAMIKGICCIDIIDDGRCDDMAFNMTFMDAHAHVIPSSMPLEQTVNLMDGWNIERMVVMEPPGVPTSDASSMFGIPGAADTYPDRFIVLYGGEAKAMLEANAGNMHPGEADTSRFIGLLEDAADSGIYSGFGEIGLRYFGSIDGWGADVAIPGNHPWMLAMADIAAEHNLPIAVHMEATDSDLEGLEALLGHNENAIIVWNNAGWSNTGAAVPEVIGGLMEIHPNLYASIKLRRPSSPEMEVASVLDGDGNIRDEWLNAFKAYPGRFMIGTDLKLGFGPSENPRQITEMYQDLLAWLPEGLDEKIAIENAERLYG